MSWQSVSSLICVVASINCRISVRSAAGNCGSHRAGGGRPCDRTAVGGGASGGSCVALRGRFLTASRWCSRGLPATWTSASRRSFAATSDLALLTHSGWLRRHQPVEEQERHHHDDSPRPARTESRACGRARRSGCRGSCRRSRTVMIETTSSVIEEHPADHGAGGDDVAAKCWLWRSAAAGR